jgi:alanyl-tRNA synthetase
MANEKSEFNIPFFLENDFIRKKCNVCNSYYWTQNQDSTNCSDSPCQEYTFIGKPPTKRSYDIDGMRDLFLSFFERNDHEIINPYPIVARWRDDVYLVGASIYDFQPYVTEGIIQPPANPLVISQPCLRFTDVDNVGPTAGRHLVIFEMGGAHAFNHPNKEIYWKNNTIRLHHDLLTKELGVKSELISYKEGFWSGGGNAGPDVEGCVEGLEISTLVFMSYVNDNGNLKEMPIKTVDTGYGIERWSWLSQGSPSGFHAAHSPVLKKILNFSGLNIDEKIIIENTKISGANVPKTDQDRLLNRKKVAKRLDMDVREIDDLLTKLEAAFTISDHTKALCFLLSEGVVPSNVREGYLARLLFRRSYRMMRILGIEKNLVDIADSQITNWSKEFKILRKMRDEIVEAIKIEESKYKRTLERGADLVKRLSTDIKSKGKQEIPSSVLVELYDSHGLVPDLTKEFAKDLDIKIEIPNNFFSMVAERHSKIDQTQEQPKIKDLEKKISKLPTTRAIFYEEPYRQRFKSKVLSVLDKKYLVLKDTCFYPEGGGQPADYGIINFRNKSAKVLTVQKIGNVILHEIKGPSPKVGETVEGEVDWDRRFSLMRHHTSTHILIGAIRRVLGEHAWQAGAEKGVEKSRLDISHYESLRGEEIEKIEELACETIQKNIPVDKMWMPREEAEQSYGFRIYQGGAVPGAEIRIVKVGDWDVEACGGLHLNSTGEVGILKILRTDRIQDGVERIIFASGSQAIKQIQERDRVLLETASMLNVPIERVIKKIGVLLDENKKIRKNLEKLREQTFPIEADELLEKALQVNGTKLIVEKKINENEENLIKLGEEIITKDAASVLVFIVVVNNSIRLLVHAGKKAIELGADASKLADQLAVIIGGKGGGRKFFGQGGGTKINNIEKIEPASKEILSKQLKK